MKYKYQITTYVLAIIGLITSIWIIFTAVGHAIDYYVDQRISLHDNKDKSHSNDNIINYDNTICHVEADYSKNNTLVFKSNTCGNSYSKLPPEILSKIDYTCLTYYSFRNPNSFVNTGPSKCPANYIPGLI